MTQQPFNAAALRGAVDLSAMASQQQQPPAAAGPSTPPAGGDAGAQDSQGVMVEVTNENLQTIVGASVTHPVVMVLWAEQFPESATTVQTLAAKAREEGRFQLATVDIQAQQEVAQALLQLAQQAFGQVQQLPVAFGWLQGQPVPLLPGPATPEQIDGVLTEFLQAAVANGITGRVQGGAAPESEGEEEPLPPLHQEAVDAIDAGDLDAAAAAYEKAIQANPKDDDARLGLAQVGLLRRTQGVDLQAARQKAADNPDDVDAQTSVADLDVLGGHIEDAFTRLIDLVRRTSGDEREKVRTHLVELFDVVGSHDDRVRKARTTLMSALF